MRRRSFLGVAAGALGATLAGCTGGSDDGQGSDGTPTDGSGDPAGTGTTTTTGDGAAETTGGETTTGPSDYSVTMAPVGEVTFESPPDRYVVYESGYADMGVALGQADGLAAVGNAARYHTTYYDELDGVSVDKGGITQLLGDSYQIDKELFYDLDPDLHLIDPEWLINNGFFKLERDDVEEVRENVAPFLGNTIFRRTDEWHDYRYYTMYGAFEKVATAFGEEDRFRRFASLHDDYVARVQAKLPAPDDRPNALLCFGDSDEPEAFYPYRLSGNGTNKKQYHDLGIADALAGTGIGGLSTTDRGQIDYETMLEVDPDAVLLRGHETKTAEEFRETVVAFMEDHPVASQLAAVENDMVFRGGPIYQGPIAHLFTLERAAKRLFPDTFSGELFDRSEVAAIVRGEE